MSTMIQVRNVPEALHRKLKSRAALEGKSLSEYLLGELRKMAEIPTPDEMRERLHRLSKENPRETAEQIIRAARDAE